MQMEFTGDVGYVDGDGYLYLTDRKAVIILAVNIIREKRDALILHPAVEDVAVFGVQSGLWEEVKAVVQPAPVLLKTQT